jgi:hypothetical protein
LPVGAEEPALFKMPSGIGAILFTALSLAIAADGLCDRADRQKVATIAKIDGCSTGAP